MAADGSPFFSIILPTYNRSFVIGRAIDSVVQQEFVDWELIVVDDGSTDQTQDIVRSYSDQRIKYFYQPNQERSSARNQGFAQATGRWICFLDSDDVYLPNHLWILKKAIDEQTNYKIIRTGLLIYEDGLYKKRSAYNENNSITQYPYECFTMAVYLREILPDKPFDTSFFVYEDLHFLLKLGLQFDIFVLEKWTGIYYCDPTSSGGVGPNYEKNLTNKKRCLDDILTWNDRLILPFLKRSRCLAEILLLAGHMRYRPRNIPRALMNNILCFFRFPKPYISLVFRILFVKWGEWTGWYQSQYRF